MGGHASYLAPMLSPARVSVIVNKTVECIEQRINPHYDAIVYRGQSGALIAPIVAYRLGKPCVPVRKDEEVKHMANGEIISGSHSSYQVELLADYARYLIVDDLIDSGKTCKAIIQACALNNMECMGIVCYNQGVYADWMPSVKRSLDDLYWKEPSVEGMFYPDETDIGVDVFNVGRAMEYANLC